MSYAQQSEMSRRSAAAEAALCVVAQRGVAEAEEASRAMRSKAKAGDEAKLRRAKRWSVWVLCSGTGEGEESRQAIRQESEG